MTPKKIKKVNSKSKPKSLYKYEKEIDTIVKHIEPRIIDVCSKFARGIHNEATMFAFWVGIGGDLDEALKRIHKPKKMKW
jgi:hypothetical protein